MSRKQRISIDGDVKGDIAVITVIGPVNADDLIAFVNDWHPQNVVRRVLWDARKATFHALSPKDFVRIASVAERHRGLRGENPKTAIVVSSYSDEMLMAALTARQQVMKSVDQKVFRSLKDARAWLEDDRCAP